MGFTAPLQDNRQILLCIAEGNVGRKESHTQGSVKLDQVPGTAPENGTDEDIRVENDHVNGQCDSRDDAAP